MHKSNNKNRAAFFDLDLTLTNKDCFRLFLKSIYLYRFSGLIFIPYLLGLLILRKFKLISLKTFKGKSLICLKGMSQERIWAMGNLYFRYWIKQLLRPKALEKIKWHKYRGDRIFIISGSPDIYVHAVCDFIGCDDYACTRLEYDHNNFTGRILGNDCLGSEKERLIFAMAEWHKISLKESVAYSDHESDLLFLETVGKKIAVAPTRKLGEIALKKNWEIVQW